MMQLWIYRQFREHARMGYDIGSHPSNNLAPALPDMLIKMASCNDDAVAELSDAPTITLTADAGYLAQLRLRHSRRE